MSTNCVSPKSTNWRLICRLLLLPSLFLALLSGCSTQPSVIQAPLPDPTPNLSIVCPPLPNPPTNDGTVNSDSTLGAVTAWAATVIEGYYVPCQRRVVEWQGFYKTIRDKQLKAAP